MMTGRNEKQYSVVGYDSKGNAHVLQDSISYEERKSILDALGRMGEAVLALDYYYIVKGNFKDLQKKLYHACERQDYYRKLNRCLFNLLDSFYVYIKEYERFFKDTMFRDKFTTKKRNLYNKNLPYRLLYQLRNYSLHYRLPVELKEQSVYLDPEKLLQSYGQWQKDFIVDLQEMCEKGVLINLEELCQEGDAFFENMQYQFFALLFEWIKTDINLVAEHLCVEDGQIQKTVITETQTGRIVRNIAEPMTTAMQVLGEYAHV